MASALIDKAAELRFLHVYVLDTLGVCRAAMGNQ